MMRLTALILAAALFAATCGNDDSADDVSAAPTEDPTEAPADDAAGGTRLAEGEDAFAIADLTIEVTHPEADPVTYRLSCLADTATIDNADAGVSAEAACAQLLEPEAVDRLVVGDPGDRICTEQYGGPDLAQITGTVDGAEVDTVINRENGCGIDDWDRLLGSVLPPPIGVT